MTNVVICYDNLKNSVLIKDSTTGKIEKIHVSFARWGAGKNKRHRLSPSEIPSHRLVQLASS